MHTQDTLLKYIGGLHTYLSHTILMFNPTRLDEVCVQATHLEARGKQNLDGNEESEFKGKWKKKRNENSRKEKGNFSANTVLKKAMMRTIVGNFIRS